MELQIRRKTDMNPEEAAMRQRMQQCSILNGYDGLDEFQVFAKNNPEVAFDIAWSLLLGREDPGRDDQALCVDLMELLVELGGRERVEALILKEWPALSDSLRRNITLVSGSTKAISTDFGKQLFHHPTTRIEQRHHLAAGLASSETDRQCAKDVVTLVTQIGRYSEGYRQAILDSFVADVMTEFGRRR
jgi:hypothetical protein